MDLKSRAPVEAVDGHIVVRPGVSLPRLTLKEMVEAFDPQVHGGELMADKPRGAEFR